MSSDRTLKVQRWLELHDIQVADWQPHVRSQGTSGTLAAALAAQIPLEDEVHLGLQLKRLVNTEWRVVLLGLVDFAAVDTALRRVAAKVETALIAEGIRGLAVELCMENTMLLLAQTPRHELARRADLTNWLTAQLVLHMKMRTLEVWDRRDENDRATLKACATTVLEVFRVAVDEHAAKSRKTGAYAHLDESQQDDAHVTRIDVSRKGLIGAVLRRVRIGCPGIDGLMLSLRTPRLEDVSARLAALAAIAVDEVLADEFSSSPGSSPLLRPSELETAVYHVLVTVLLAEGVRLFSVAVEPPRNVGRITEEAAGHLWLASENVTTTGAFEERLYGLWRLRDQTRVSVPPPHVLGHVFPIRRRSADDDAEEGALFYVRASRIVRQLFTEDRFEGVFDVADVQRKTANVLRLRFERSEPISWDEVDMLPIDRRESPTPELAFGSIEGRSVNVSVDAILTWIVEACISNKPPTDVLKTTTTDPQRHRARRQFTDRVLRCLFERIDNAI